jgi:hypothetical protein
LMQRPVPWNTLGRRLTGAIRTVPTTRSSPVLSVFGRMRNWHARSRWSRALLQTHHGLPVGRAARCLPRGQTYVERGRTGASEQRLAHVRWDPPGPALVVVRADPWPGRRTKRRISIELDGQGSRGPSAPFSRSPARCSARA